MPAQLIVRNGSGANPLFEFKRLQMFEDANTMEAPCLSSLTRHMQTCSTQVPTHKTSTTEEVTHNLNTKCELSIEKPYFEIYSESRREYTNNLKTIFCASFVCNWRVDSEEFLCKCRSQMMQLLVQQCGFPIYTEQYRPSV